MKTRESRRRAEGLIHRADTPRASVHCDAATIHTIRFAGDSLHASHTAPPVKHCVILRPSMRGGGLRFMTSLPLKDDDFPESLCPPKGCCHCMYSPSCLHRSVAHHSSSPRSRRRAAKRRTTRLSLNLPGPELGLRTGTSAGVPLRLQNSPPWCHSTRECTAVLVWQSGASGLSSPSPSLPKAHLTRLDEAG